MENIKIKLPKRLTEEQIIAKGHTHIVSDSLRFDELKNKQMVTINTVDASGAFDGNTREIATSDLHQCIHTEATKEAMDNGKRNQKAKDRRANAKAAQGDDELVIVESLDDVSPADRLAAAIEK